MPPGLDGPECPPAAAYLWQWYMEIAAARGGSGFGPNPLSFTEIEAWSRLTGNRPGPWETGTLRAFDDAFFRIREENDSRKDKT